MEERKNLCAMLPVALHARVRQEQEKAGMTLGEYVEAMITEYYDWKDGKIMTGEMRTLPAFCVPSRTRIFPVLWVSRVFAGRC